MTLTSGRQVKEEEAPPAEPLGLRKLLDSYLDVHSIGSMEANSLATVRVHLGFFVAALGGRFPAQNHMLTDLHRHADRRAKLTGQHSLDTTIPLPTQGR